MACGAGSTDTGRVTRVGTRLTALSPQWLALALILRVACTGTAVVLLAVHRVTDHDAVLIAIVSGYTAITSLAVLRRPGLVARPVAWALDLLVLLALVVDSGDWRSPFYLLALTALAAPAAALRPTRAVALGASFSLVYVVIAYVIGPNPLRVGAQTTAETLATHLSLPVLLAFGISYAAEAMRRLQGERRRSERLAIEAERKRIAWELHDSAKQRVHAAHLLLDALAGRSHGDRPPAIDQVLGELRAAAADMDTSVAELRSPLEGRPLKVALRERAAALTVQGGPVITVEGELPALAPLQAAHAYRVAAEALTNAVRHADADHIGLSLEVHRAEARIVIADDGLGVPERLRPGANGLRAMRNRAATIDGRLDIRPGAGGTGTVVDLSFPIDRAFEEVT